MRLVSLFAFLLFPFFAFSAETETSKPEHDVIVLPVTDRHEGDFFAFGKSIEVSGTVTGDVYVMGGQVFIDGIVEGSVLVAAGTAEISGEVKQNVRGLGGQLRISGIVGHNVTILAGNADITSAAKIGGDLVSVAGYTDLAGTVGFDATLLSSGLRIAGTVKRNVKAYSEQVRVTSRGVIGGNFDYRSSTPAWIDENAKITGKIKDHPSLVSDLLKGTWLQGVLIGSKFAALFMNFLFTFFMGLIVLKLFPKSIHEAIAALKKHHWKALIYGIVLLVLFPLAALLLLMTILGAPFALTVLALNVVTFYTVKIIPVLWVSNWVLPKIGLKAWKIPTYSLGLFIYFPLSLIPYFGPIMAFVALLFGLGSVVVSQGRHIHPHPHPKH